MDVCFSKFQSILFILLFVRKRLRMLDTSLYDLQMAGFERSSIINLINLLQISSLSARGIHLLTKWSNFTNICLNFRHGLIDADLNLY